MYLIYVYPFSISVVKGFANIIVIAYKINDN
jgi:hypothetical protein